MSKINFGNDWVNAVTAFELLAKAGLPHLAMSILHLITYAKEDAPPTFSCHECDETISTAGGHAEAIKHGKDNYIGDDSMGQDDHHMACC